MQATTTYAQLRLGRTVILNLATRLPSTNLHLAGGVVVESIKARARNEFAGLIEDGAIMRRREVGVVSQIEYPKAQLHV